MKRYFITGIGTNVGKTFCAAVITEALQADYYKPVQSGTIEGSDASFVKELLSNTRTVIHHEAYTFAAPVSPHLAAAIENTSVELEKIYCPLTANILIIEGAGGLMVPLNSTNYVIELAKKFDTEVVLVVRNYLGCINHSILSIDYLLRHNYRLKGLVLNGSFDPMVERSIIDYANVPVLARIPEVSTVNKQTIHELSKHIDRSLWI